MSGTMAEVADRIAVVQDRGDRRRIVIAERTPDGPRVLASDTVPVADGAALGARLGRHRVEHVLRVLPAAAMVCRVREAPDAAASELGEVVALLAEAELPPSAPPHRRGWALLPIGAGQQRTVLLGWPETEAAPPPVGDVETCTSEVVGLFGLVRLAPSGARVAATADGATGSIGIVAFGRDMTARTVREVPGTPDAFRTRVATALAETGARAGCSVDAVGESGCMLDAATREALIAVPGVEPTDRWIDEYGVATGAALYALQAGPMQAGLVSLVRDAPSERTPFLTRIASTVSRPGIAVALVAISLAVAVAAPLGFEYARAEILEDRIAALETELEEAGEGLTFEQRVQLYQALDRSRWPMTKIIADIAAALPAERDDSLALVETIEVESGDRFIVRGTADTLELFRGFRDALGASGVFTDVKETRVETEEGTTGPVSFDISGWVSRPFEKASGLEDYAEQNIAERFYGEGAELVGDGQVVSAESRRGDAAPRSRSASASRNRSDDAASDEPRPSRRGQFEGGSRNRPAAEAEAVPPPLTEDEIEAMDQIGAMKEALRRGKAARADGVSAEDVDRLKDEAERLRDRARRAKEEGS